MRAYCDKNTKAFSDLNIPKQGHSLSEYLIILTLIAIVAIPTLQFLASNTSDGYNIDQNNYDKLNALLSPRNTGSGGGSGGTVRGNDGSYGSVLEEFLAETGGGYTFNYDNGEISANGTETNSGEGGQLTQQLASSLSVMLDLVKEVDDLPANIQASLDQLADFGQGLANAQESFDNAPEALKNQGNITVYNDSTETKCSGWIFKTCDTELVKGDPPTVTTESQIRTDVLAAYESFVKQRAETVDLLNSLPPGTAKDTVQQLVENYSTAITTIADQNYFAEGSYEIGGTESSGSQIVQVPKEQCDNLFGIKFNCKTIMENRLSNENSSELSAEQEKLLTLGGGIASEGTSLPLFPPLTREYSEKIRESQRDARELWRDKAKVDREIARVERDIQELENKQNLLQAEIERQMQAVSEAESSGDSKKLKRAQKNLDKAESKYANAEEEKTDAQYDLISAQKESRQLNAQAAAIDAETKAIQDMALAEAKERAAEKEEG